MTPIAPRAKAQEAWSPIFIHPGPLPFLPLIYRTWQRSSKTFREPKGLNMSSTIGLGVPVPKMLRELHNNPNPPCRIR